MFIYTFYIFLDKSLIVFFTYSFLRINYNFLFIEFTLFTYIFLIYMLFILMTNQEHTTMKCNHMAINQNSIFIWLNIIINFIILLIAIIVGYFVEYAVCDMERVLDVRILLFGGKSDDDVINVICFCSFFLLTCLFDI